MASTPAKRTALHAANTIQVRAKPKAIQGTLTVRRAYLRCMVGTARHRKPPNLKDDGCTPAGLFHMRELRYRADRLSTQPQSGLPVFKSKQTDGWCDDPEDVAYNRVVTLPYQSDAEPMWRDDQLYDVLAVIGYNDAPVVAGAGSAIFMHVMRPPTDDHQYTTGCVSMKIENCARRSAAKCTPSTMIDIRAVA